MDLRADEDTGTHHLDPERYGLSHLGLPLEVWMPAGECRILVHAGIHGEEAETTFVLSQALRTLRYQSSRCAVVLAANPDGLLRGTRGNARGVDLNRNFPTKSWQSDPVRNRLTLDGPREVRFSPGQGPGSEPETQALMDLIGRLRPEVVVALHAPLGCIDDEGATPLGRWVADQTGLPLVSDVGYPTPGSFGDWGREQGIGVVTYELPMQDKDTLVKEHVPTLTRLLSGVCTEIP
jgi:protein MpaA